MVAGGGGARQELGSSSQPLEIGVLLVACRTLGDRGAGVGERRQFFAAATTMALGAPSSSSALGRGHFIFRGGAARGKSGSGLVLKHVVSRPV